jgi:hypothetical protein
VRAKAAELFNKMMADKLVGPKVKITLTKFLPTIFMDAMRENPEISVHMFEGKMMLMLIVLMLMLKLMLMLMMLILILMMLM